MLDYLRAARLLEEKAATLPHGSSRRAHLLAIAKASRDMGLNREDKQKQGQTRTAPRPAADG
jgi:hypothetical protein